ncbi:MAG: 3-keto-5-aminohexanoate cleavage protein [Candidatus Nanopelagicales bacterium]
MSTSAFITCAVTGSGDSTGASDKVPVTPEQIANSAIEAAQAGAAVVHIHVREPATGKGTRTPAYYREVVERVRASSTDVILNLTTGMGGDLVLGAVEQPLPVDDAGTDMAGATERMVHVAELLPEICTLDCGTMNFAAGGEYIMVNTPGMVREMARQMKALGVKPEVEIFDTGDLVLLNEMVREGLFDDPVMVQLCMGIPYGAPNDPLTFAAMVNNLPPNSTFSAFSIGRFQLAYAAQSVLFGGNVRVGLEDNIYLSKGVLASNGDLVGRARTILEGMNVRLKTPAEVREELGLVKHG